MENVQQFNVPDFSKEALKTVLGAIKVSNSLPSPGTDYDFFSVIKVFHDVMELESEKIILLMERLLHQQGFKVIFKGMSFEEVFDVLVDANDSIIERVGINIDEALGLRKNQDDLLMTSSAAEVGTSWNKKYNYKRLTSDGKVWMPTYNIVKPQLKFKAKIDNSNSAFVPVITEKPNSLKPLAVIWEDTEYGEMYCHPYQFELDHLKIPDKHLIKVELKAPKKICDTPLHFIDTVQKVNELVATLKEMTEFAVDLEHHSYRSYLGITCLMQISTRDADYLIDTLELRSDLQLLNEAFTDPKIVKVFHGSDMDIEWLQRDLGIYVVNMFDTGQAMRVLSFAHFSLAFLLKHYCKFDADKQYQLADWRIRPLSEEMVQYARQDTHYLLYIYDCMKNELIDKGNENKNLLLSVYQRSSVLCEKRYIKPVFNSESYMTLYQKSRKVFNARQLYVLMELYRWRDEIAREQDESTGYVLPNHMLLHIAEILPRETAGIVACCNPVPLIVRQNLNEIHRIILVARELSLVKPLEKEILIKVDERRHQFEMENVFHCPHDVSHLEGMGDTHDSAFTIFDIWNKYGDESDEHFIVNQESVARTKPETLATAIACSRRVPSTKVQGESSKTLSFENYCSPFQRYKLVCPLLEKDSSKALQLSISDLAKTREKLRDPVEEVHAHFQDLLRIHGGVIDATKHAAKSEVLEKTEEITPQVDSKNHAAVEVEVVDTVGTKKLKKKRKKDEKRKARVKDKEKASSEKIVQENNLAESSKLPKSKKLKASVDQPPEEEVDDETLLEEDGSPFKPFEYDKADFNRFSGGVRQRSRRGRGRFSGKRHSNHKSFRGKREIGGHGGRGRGRGRGRNQNLYQGMKNF